MKVYGMWTCRLCRKQKPHSDYPPSTSHGNSVCSICKERLLSDPMYVQHYTGRKDPNRIKKPPKPLKEKPTSWVCRICRTRKPILDFAIRKSKPQYHVCKECRGNTNQRVVWDQLRTMVIPQKEHKEEYARTYYKAYREKRNTFRKPQLESIEYPNGTCGVICKHHEILKEDPEHLSTEFIQTLIGIKCKEQ